MYTLLVAGSFVSRRRSRRAFSGQHTTCSKANRSSFSQKTVPIGFCCGGFSSTAGYVPGNEAHLAMSDFRSPLRWFLAEKCSPFLSGKLREKIFRLFPFEQSLSASMQGVNSNFFPSFVTLKRCVTAPLASPCTGQEPVSILDCRLDSTRKNFLVNRQIRRKYFRFCPYFTGVF